MTRPGSLICNPPPIEVRYSSIEVLGIGFHIGTVFLAFLEPLWPFVAICLVPCRGLDKGSYGKIPRLLDAELRLHGAQAIALSGLPNQDGLT